MARISAGYAQTMTRPIRTARNYMHPRANSTQKNRNAGRAVASLCGTPSDSPDEAKISVAKLPVSPDYPKKFQKVPARGFEPRTIGLKDRCSNQAELRRRRYEFRLSAPRRAS